MLDWEVLEKVIEIPHDLTQYEPPIHKHGTHVAGILGADWRSGDSESDRLSAAPGEEVRCQGVCPRIQLYDLLDDPQESKDLANWISDILDNMGDESVIDEVRAKVSEICARKPVYREPLVDVQQPLKKQA